MEKKRIWASLDTFIEGGDILGRKVAGEGFLRALLEADPFDAYHFFPESTLQTKSLRTRLHELFPVPARRGAFAFFPRHTLPTLVAEHEYHCFHLSDFLTHATALERVRNRFSGRIFPITGATHSLSYARYMPALLGRLWPGTSPRDAVLATSRSAVAVLLATFADLRTAYGLDERVFPAPGIRRIPLSVPSAAPATPKAVRDFRTGLGLKDDEPLILTLARFSPYSKMDLLPAVEALKRAGDLGLPPGSLYLAAGWADEGDDLPNALEAHAAALGVRMRTMLRPDADTCRLLYSAADIFFSPSDNIQETFGLTVAEAASYGLPAVVSDFDGYRDITEHETTGLLVPTLGFAESAETDVLAGLWFDNQYHLKLAQQCVVDVPAMAFALARLGTDAALRRRMGEAAKQRAEAEYSPTRCIERHVSLWDELNALPIPQDAEDRLRRAEHPLTMRFARLFAGHFSRTLTPETAAGLTLRRTEAGDALYRGTTQPALYAGMEAMLDRERLRRILLGTRKPVRAADLLDATDPMEAERQTFHLLWALKRDYLEIVDGEGVPPPQTPPAGD